MFLLYEQGVSKKLNIADRGTKYLINIDYLGTYNVE